MTAGQLRAALEGGQVNVAQVMHELPGLLEAEAGLLRQLADTLDAGAAALREDGPAGELLVAAQLQTTIALRAADGVGRGIGAVLDLLLVVLQRCEGMSDSG